MSRSRERARPGRVRVAAAVTVVATLALSGCVAPDTVITPAPSVSTGPVVSVPVHPSPSATPTNPPVDCGGAPTSLSVSAWNVSTTPEFSTLVDGFRSICPQVDVTLRDYAASAYASRVSSDLRSGTAADILALPSITQAYTWATGGYLMRVPDVVAALPRGVSGVEAYVVAGRNYGVPYRQESWLLFYNRDLFQAAGLPVPDGTWSWDTYATVAKDLTAKLAEAGLTATGAYQDPAPAAVQGFANAQAGNEMSATGAFVSGDYTYMTPYYDRALDLAAAGAQPTLEAITAGHLTYGKQFGGQRAAMMLMGSSYLPTLIDDQTSGRAERFAWGVAPVPQVTAATIAAPVTFGDPTGLGINARIATDKTGAAKAFLAYAASPAAAEALAGLGITPAMSSEAITVALFSLPGMPTDALSKFAVQTHATRPLNPPGQRTAEIQSVLAEAHTAILTGAAPVADALVAAGQRIMGVDASPTPTPTPTG